MNLKSVGGEKTRGRFFVSNIIGTSPRIQEVIRLVEKVADSPLNVLITGESGTGKELIARTIHYNSSRFGKPFIDINCAALPESLLESELFGIEKGIATGVERRVGKIEMASGGTLFLDEIGDMSLAAQAKLLRVLQERKMERVGGRSTINVDVRVLAATNKDLKDEIKEGRFREDLYYRLNVVHIHMPPLREMREDIPLLAQYFLSSFANELGRGYMHFSSEAMDCLVNYDWHGNVRELENEVKRAAILADNDVIDESDLSENVRSIVENNPVLGRDVLQYAPAEEENQSLKEAVEELEIRLIIETLEKNSGNKQKTAKILGLTRHGLIKKLKKYEERILKSKSISIDNQPGKQEDKIVHIRTKKTDRPFDHSTPFDETQDRLRQGSGLTAQGSRQPERRHLTVMFCDLVGFTALSEQVDPEDLHEIMRAYLDVCSNVVSRYEGRIARYFNDGLLVYFGYPSAHEDDAKRAVLSGLEIVKAIEAVNFAELPDRYPHFRDLSLSLQVRVGIHTGLVVIGDMEVKNTREPIEIVGGAPNIAARLLSVAEPNTVVISSATYKLVEGLFEYHYLGEHTLKGFSTPLDVYRVLHESDVRSRFDVAITKGLTPFIGREKEVEFLFERWERVKEGRGRGVLINGEPGIGKSRLVQALKEQLAEDPHVKIESRCSAYYQNSPLYPMINHLQRLLQFGKDDSTEEKLNKLEIALGQHGFSLQESVPLFASLLSLPLSKNYSPLSLTPQKQKQKLLETLLSWLLKDAEKQPVLFIVEDLHWTDPSTLEFLNLVADRISEARILALFTFRPDFNSPWTKHSHLTQITLDRLTRKQMEAMIEEVTGGKTLPAEVINQIMEKSDGIPLFIEELTKMVIESGILRRENGNYVLTESLSSIAIPNTLQDSLMARLDRLGTGKEIAQLGATIGREFTYDLLSAISSLDEAALQRDLSQLVGAELLYQRGSQPQARYFFKHALIQEIAYQSLLKSKRGQYHQKIAQVLEERFPETAETQPELLAHHYTEAGLIEQAIPYWQKAGESAIKRSANLEAIGHLTKGLELLKTLPDTPERARQELAIQIALVVPLTATRGYTDSEIEKIYLRAQELCQQLGETHQLFRVLQGLQIFYYTRSELKEARELGEQLLTLARTLENPEFLLEAHNANGMILAQFGEFASALEHLEQGFDLYSILRNSSQAFHYPHEPGVFYLSWTAYIQWWLGYPDQALKRSHEAIILAQQVSHPLSLALAFFVASFVHLCRREEEAVQNLAESVISLSTEQGFPYWIAGGTIMRGWALAEQMQIKEGIEQIRWGIDVYRAMGAEGGRAVRLTLLAGAYWKAEQAEEGLAALAEALTVGDKTGDCWWEAEIYRLKGELLLAHPDENQSEAQTCFRKAIDVARRQDVKSLELRATVNLSRLLQRQGRKEEARQMLAEIYSWFTEGFDTKDLQEAKALLEELS